MKFAIPSPRRVSLLSVLCIGTAFAKPPANYDQTRITFEASGDAVAPKDQVAVTLKVIDGSNIDQNPSYFFKLDFDGQGNAVTRRDGALFTRPDGSQGAYQDVWFSLPTRTPLLAGR